MNTYDESVRAGHFARSYMVDAAYTQLVGLCRGCLADNALCDAEIGVEGGAIGRGHKGACCGS